MPIDVDRLLALDVHVHLEHTGELSAADAQAQQYFGAGGTSRDWQTLAHYYRSRRMACVVFAVDETLSKRPPVPNDAVVQFAAENADIAIPFASLNPTRGLDAVREAKRLVSAARSW